MRSFFLILTVCLYLAAAAIAAEPAGNPPSGRVLRTTQHGRWLIQETDNFRVYSLPETKAAGALPGACEALRAQLLETWFSQPGSDWSPKCDVVVHSGRAGYVRALGQGSEQSSGCATIEIEPGRVTRRRIDLRGDAADCFDCALPHELTHVIVAERFTRTRIPRWADEGMAILAETRQKQERRRTAFQQSLASSRAYSAADLTTLSEYPAPNRLDIFYGQSASLVAFLIERESPAKFLEFLELSTTATAEQSLSKVYGVSDWREIEAAWRTRMLTRGETAELLATRLDQIMSFRNVD